MVRVLALFLSFLLHISFLNAQKGFKIIEQKQKKQVDIFYNDRHLTSYCYYDSIRKPILFPINTEDGITITRGYPIKPQIGERTDHPHHTGLWFNYESVNGLDFWNNSTAIAPDKRYLYGTIIHDKVEKIQATINAAEITVSANWIRPDHKVLLKEQTEYIFRVEGNDFIIDRKTKLTATDTTVEFKDTKDGMIAIRVARELEMPSNEATKFVDNKGNVTTVNKMNNDNVTGMYNSSEGLSGDSVWGSKGRWVMLSGKKDGKEITIAIMDHPKNVGYPTYWHARGYGLFAANPLGRKVFSNGKEELNFKLAAGKSVLFYYRIIIHSGSYLTEKEMNDNWQKFSLEKNKMD